MSCLDLLVHWLECMTFLSTDLFYCVWMISQIIIINWVDQSQLRLFLWRALHILIWVSFVLFGLIGILIWVCGFFIQWPYLLCLNDIAGNNQLNGSIPTEIGSLTSLTRLDLSKFCLVWTYWYIDLSVWLFYPMTLSIVFEWHCR